jgi:hypothetical protein
MATWGRPDIVYDRADVDIDIDAEPFQLGRRLYEAEVIHARIEKGEVIDPAEIKELAERYCELINWTGQLRASYRIMRDAADGKVRFE